MRGKFLGAEIDSKTGAEYFVWECPFCGKVSYQGTWGRHGVLEDVAGCPHWTGVGDESEYFQEQVD